MSIQSGFLGTQGQMADLEGQAANHSLGNLAAAGAAAGAGAGGAKPQGGQNPSNSAGRAARNSSSAGASDSVGENNASASPASIASPGNTSGRPACDCICPEKFPPITILGAWNQSNRGSNQTAVGSYVPAERLAFFEEVDFDLNYQFNPPNCLLSWGLARAVHPPGEFGNIYGQEPYEEWVCGWAVQIDGGSQYNFAIAGFPYNAGEVDPSWNWRQDFEVELTQPISSASMLRVAKFFYSQLGRWCNMIPNPEVSNPTCYSARRLDEGQSYSSSLGKPAYGASFVAYCNLYSVRRLAELTLSSFLALPYMDMTTYASIVFLRQDIASGELVAATSLTAAQIESTPDFSIIPMVHSQSQPMAWYQDAARVFASSKSDSTETIRYTHFGFKPEGNEITGRRSESYEATNSPLVLEGLAFKAEAEATSYNAAYGDIFDAVYSGSPPAFSHGTWVMAQVDVAPDASEDYRTLDGATYVQLPAEVPNTQRFGTLAGQSAEHWPAIKNSGNCCIDSAGVEWRTILKPIQRLYGGHYTTETTEEQINTWEKYHQIYNDCLTYPFESTGNFVKVDPGYTIDSPLIQVIGNSEDCGDLVEVVWYYDRGLQAQTIATWRQKQVILWETWLQATDLQTGAMVEFDISQRFTVAGSASLTSGGFSTATGTEEDVPAADNVHQVISLPEIGRVLILRDLHGDGPDGSPAPYLEIYNLSELTLETTIALGTADLLSADKGDWKAGDREWDAYWKGPPRIKGCLRLEEDGPIAPQFVIGVWERKKVVSSESDFGRAVYHYVDLSDPENPVVTTEVKTSADLGPGNLFYLDPDTNFPLWDDWDSVVIASGSIGWNKRYKLNDTCPQDLG